MKGMVLYEFKNKKALVIGAGKTGIRRANLLAHYGAQVTLIDKLKNKDLENLDPFVNYLQKDFKRSDISGFDIIVASTNKKKLNREIVRLANNSGKLSASSEKDEEASLSFPAVYENESTTAAFYTGAPFLTKELRDAYAKTWTEEKVKRLTLLEKARERQIDSGSLDLKQLLKMSNNELEELINNKPRTIRVGTRGSKLALAQTKDVIKQLKQAWPEYDFEIIIIKTTGDIDQKTALSELVNNRGEKNIFVSQIESALLDKTIDMAVHSLKDMPSWLDSRFEISSLPPKREDPRDILLIREEVLEKLGQDGFKIGTGSARRRVEILRKYPQAVVENIRGNIDTRIEKLSRGEYDAILLAKAGLNRLGISEEFLKKKGIVSLDPEILPALRQGILGLEYRSEDKNMKKVLEKIGDLKTGEELAFETEILNLIGADCSTVIGGAFEKKENREYFKILYAPDPEKNQVIIDLVACKDKGAAQNLAERVLKRAEVRDWSI